MTMAEGLRMLRSATWSIFPEGGQVQTPRRLACERGVNQLSQEDLRAFPLGLPLHTAAMMMDMLALVCVFRHHAFPADQPRWRVPPLESVLVLLPPAAFEAVVHQDTRPRSERKSTMTIGKEGDTLWTPTRAQTMEASHPGLQAIHAFNLAHTLATWDLIKEMPRTLTFRHRIAGNLFVENPT